MKSSIDVTLTNGQQFNVSYSDLSTIFVISPGSYGQVFEMIHNPIQTRFAVKV